MKRTVEEILNNLVRTYKTGTYRIQIEDSVCFDKEFRKDTPLYEEIRRIFFEISKDPFRGEPLKHDLRNKWRVPIRHHSYVLIYRVDRETRTVTIESYVSHNGAYENHHRSHRR